MLLIAVAVGVAALFAGVLSVLVFHDVLINAYVKPRLIGSFASEYPVEVLHLGELQYDVWTNTISCDYARVTAVDGSHAYSVQAVSIAGIDLPRLLLRRDTTFAIYANVVLVTGAVELLFLQARQKVTAEGIQVSVPKSSAMMRGVEYDQLMTDEEFFKTSRFRQTRYRVTLPLLEAWGVNFALAVRDGRYRVAHVKAHEPSAEILVNMDKPYDKNSSLPLMPNEALASIREAVVIDSIIVVDGRFHYCEKFTTHGTPGVITFTNVNVGVRHVRNHAVPPDTMLITGKATFMNSGTMTVTMALPLREDEFSMSYSGTLSAMRIDAFNTFLEVGEHRRITSGRLHSATFRVAVRSGRARGSVRLAYEHLRISLLDHRTGSAKGIMNRIYSFIGKLFVIRGTNLPDEHGKMKIGTIRYTKKKDDYFFQFVWFALRGGVGEVIGF